MAALAPAKSAVRPPQNDNALGCVELAQLAPPRLHRGSCFHVFPSIAAGSVHLCVADLPYGVTGCGWDRKIGLAAFWEALDHILSANGTAVLFGTQPFTSELVMSNREWFRYAVVWQKTRVTTPQFANRRIMANHEDILVFSKGVAASGKQNAPRWMTYNPQGLAPLDVPLKRKAEQRVGFLGGTLHNPHGSVQTMTNYPRSVLEFASVPKPLHPTQKPVDLLAYLIRTFSNPGDVVLDPTMGVGSTGVAAVQQGREFVGVEIDPEFYAKAFERIMG